MTDRKDDRGAEIVELRPKEAQRVDTERIGALYVQAGAAAAENAIGRAMEILWRRLDALEIEGAEGALRVVGLAEGVGLTTLAHCARGAADAANSGDPVASAAALARLRRAGNGAFHLVWGEEPQGA